MKTKKWSSQHQAGAGVEDVSYEHSIFERSCDPPAGHRRVVPPGAELLRGHFFHEGLLDDAIAAVRREAGYDQLERVMDAVVEYRPDWVIEAACLQAERIIEAGQAKYYHHAVDWLARARAAYQAAGREAEWQAYLGEIRTRHGRKYKLMGMMERFGER